ncbi:MAG TPA: undecaprenyl-diphosphate phosphatase [Gammaproteobacteria bacterium]|nr:undecaprenyl-diphosphate phosphatase [Gammaproteobacteria bacterium]
MATWQELILALIQGLTEFLPISSSAHLILFPRLMGWRDQGLAFDVAVHVGTLAAVMIYFRRELLTMSRDWAASLASRRLTAEARLAWGVLLGTLPVGLCGLLLKHYVETTLRSPLVIAAATIAFGLLLWWADRRGRRLRDEHSLSLGDILFIGVAQAVALIPGTSRSGITITAGLMLGLTRAAAARFSFLLSIPVIALAGMLEVRDLVQAGGPLPLSDLTLGAAASGITAYLVIHYFLRLLEQVGMLPFILYRLVLGVLLLAVFL